MSMSSSRRVELAEKSVILADLRDYYDNLCVIYASNVNHLPTRTAMFKQAKTCRTLVDQMIEAHDELTQAHRKVAE